ncbi:MAG TPA: pyridoxamine 5'-phosphate oxidase family protein [Gaiellaceae bacterium]|nr:pyridoxamine 5'-phosphate oxidase family protein [Gaiellaceae bacterium]
MTIERSQRRVGAARIAVAARRLLDASTLCAIATVTRSGGAHVHSAYFAWDPAFRIVWLSEPRALHSRNLRANPSAAVAVYDSGQTWGEPDRGIQLFGTACEIAGEDAAQAGALYARRFPAYSKTDLGAYRFYRFTPRRLKLFDEPGLGPGTFVTARVGPAGRLAWERTEIYRSDR